MLYLVIIYILYIWIPFTSPIKNLLPTSVRLIVEPSGVTLDRDV